MQNQQSITDLELINQASHGDANAYGELVDRYKQALYRHCFTIARDEDAAEDIAQESFIAAYYNLHKYDSTYRFGTWLFKIGTNKCLNYLRSQVKQVQNSDQLIAAIASNGKSPHTASLDAELHQAVSKLQPRYQAVISLHYWQGLSYSDTALVMGAPVNSVRVWLKRAKDQLRKELA